MILKNEPLLNLCFVHDGLHKDVQIIEHYERAPLAEFSLL